jgi:hypothetical protein
MKKINSKFLAFIFCPLEIDLSEVHKPDVLILKHTPIFLQQLI